MNIVIPMAGEGSRFKEAGFVFPKPLIDVGGKPMIQHVVENMWFDDAKYIFLVRKEHLVAYEMQRLLELITKGRCTIIPIDGLTEGAACTVLHAEKLIDNDDELLIANSDQIVEYSKENFDLMRCWTLADAIIQTFYASHPKWSFAKIDDHRITRVAEKKPISQFATTGVYYARKGWFFVNAVHNMMADEKNRVNGEWYVAPAFNEMISDGKIVLPFFVDKMHGMGTPEDLAETLKALRGK